MGSISRPSKDLKRLRVLVIDDDDDNRAAFQFACSGAWDLTLLEGPKKLVSGEISIAAYDVLILDLVLYDKSGAPFTRMPVPDEGFKVLKWLHDRNLGTPVVVFSALIDEELERQLSTAYQPLICIAKPVDLSKEKFHQSVERFARSHLVKAST